jgi:hypothetical protein
MSVVMKGIVLGLLMAWFWGFLCGLLWKFVQDLVNAAIKNESE